MPNKTKADAFERIQVARSGSMVRPTRAFLESLRMYALKWADNINEAIYKLPDDPAKDDDHDDDHHG